MESNKNIYKDDIKFSDLAAVDPDFAKVQAIPLLSHPTPLCLKPNGQLDFSSPETVQQLTKSLLKRDFNLKISLPPDRLCPPVPNRLNYILWIQDLLDTTSPTFSSRHDPNRGVVGLDIGTGASCIYPLLGCANYPKWRFAATDVDHHSLAYARENINQNGLQDRIKLLKTTPNGPLIPLQEIGVEHLDFLLCNPPFYTSPSDLLASATLKSRPPSSACTGSANEMVCEGGEIAFVTRIISESLIHRERVQWYTSMLGKFSSVPIIVSHLKEAGVGNWAVTEFVQGSKTRRWAVGWSFGDLRPVGRVARGVASLEKQFLPFPPEYGVVIRGDPEVLQAGVVAKINSALDALPLHWTWKPLLSMGVGAAAKNVWSRAARREAARTAESSGNSDDEDEEDGMPFVFKIHVRKISLDGDEGIEGGGDGKGGRGVEVVIRWLKGSDSVLFESFCGMLRRKVEG